MADPREEHVFLHSTKDGANKDYHLHLVPDGTDPTLWRLTYANGKHGAALKVAEKIAGAVSYDVAKKELDKTIKEKMSRSGYLPIDSGTEYQDVIPSERRSGIEPQLLATIAHDDIATRIDDPDFTWEEKMDGERRPIEKFTVGVGGPAAAATVIGTNRDGLVVRIPLNLQEAVARLPLNSFVIDGEDLGNGRYAAFDIISCPQDPHGKRPYFERRAHLKALLLAAPSPCWIDIPTADTPAAARALWKAVAARNGEGLVAKRKDAPYTPGSKSGDQFKAPFIDRATCFVSGHDVSKRSVHIAVKDAAGNDVPLKKVTIPANHEVPPIGAVVDIEYLYAYTSGGLAQPRYKGLRTDRNVEHCVQSQLKFKGPEAFTSLQDESDAEGELDDACMVAVPGM